MNKVLFITFLGIILSCTSSKESSSGLQEEQMIVTRKYAGNYMDYRATGFEDFSEKNLIWIKTTLDATYGKFSAFGKKCEFSNGDRLFLTRSYYSPGGISGYWKYYIENNSKVSYRLTDVQYDRKVLVQDLFK